MPDYTAADIETQQAVRYLIQAMKPEQVVLLAKLVDQCIKETGYGDVTIVLAQGQVQSLKVTKSYR